MTTAPACSTLSVLFIRACIGRVPRLAAFHSVMQQRRQGDDLQLRPRLAHSVVEHDRAERTGYGQCLRAGRRSLAHTFLIDGPSAALLHPHPRAPGAAAERALSAA